MVEPLLISTTVGICALIIAEVFKLIRRGRYKSSCMVQDNNTPNPPR